MTKPIEQIHAAARDGRSPKLDEIVHVTGDTSFMTGLLLEAVTRECSWFFMDVPLYAIVGVCQPPRGSLRNGFTWRAAALAVEGIDQNCPNDRSRDWGPEVFDYWSNPIRCKPFPAYGAFGHLLMTSYGGAVVVANGVHRLAAGLAWNLKPEGPGNLKQVSVKVHEERSGRISTLLDLARGGDVQFGVIVIEAERRRVTDLAGASCTVVVRSGKGRREEVWAFPDDGGCARCLRRPRSWWSLAPSSLSTSPLECHWISVPPEFLTAWRAREWVQASTGERKGSDPCAGSPRQWIPGR